MFLSVCAAFGQYGNKYGFFHPEYIGWPTDSSEFQTLRWNPVLQRTVWDTEGVGSDSTFSITDSLCFVIMGDTTCVPLDSVIVGEDSICYIITPDTICIPYSNVDGNIYTVSGALTGPRTLDQNGNKLEFITSNHSTTWNANSITPGAYLTVATNMSSITRAVLSVNNTLNHVDADAFMRYGVQGSGGGTRPLISTGLDRGDKSWNISDTNSVSIPVANLFRIYSNNGTANDSIVLNRTTSVYNRFGINKQPTYNFDFLGTGLIRDANDNTILGGLLSGIVMPGARNITLGAQAMANGYFSVNNNDNIAIGYQAMRTNQAGGAGTIAIGTEAAELYSDADDAVVIGYQAGQNGSAACDRGVLIGYQAGLNLRALGNILIGYQAGKRSTAGSSQLNTIIGYAAGSVNDYTDHNVVIGAEAGRNLTGGDNIIIGTEAGEVTTGSSNTVIGRSALSNATSADANIVIGKDAGRTISTEDSLFVVENKIVSPIEDSYLYGSVTKISPFIQINAHARQSYGVANTKYDYVAGEATLTRNYYNVDIGTGIVTDTIFLPEIATADPQWTGITSAQVGIGMELVITNWRTGVNAVVAAYNPAGTSDDLIDTHTPPGGSAGSAIILAPGDCLIIKSTGYDGAIGYWKSFN